jgi:hypothetical protein
MQVVEKIMQESVLLVLHYILCDQKKKYCLLCKNNLSALSSTQPVKFSNGYNITDFST